jgi:hypothetical protein
METLKKIPYQGGLILLTYMPFHMLFSHWLSTYTGGLEVWKITKDVFTILLVLLSVVLVVYSKAYTKAKIYIPIVVSAVIYLGLHITTYLLNRETELGVATLASVYNNRIIWYLIIGMSAVLLTPKEVLAPRLIKLILLISTFVCFLGLAQYLLPADVMKHFGYSVERGAKPSFSIDDKDDLPRVFSTLRDPNSLGAFLILPITLITVLLLTPKHQNRRQMLGGMLIIHSLILFLTFSRAAWIGTAISVSVALWIGHKSKFKKILDKYWLILAGLIALLVFGGFLLRDQYFVQNVIFHSDETTQAELDSNDLHLEFIRRGVNGIIEQPLGHGPGTAGLVSIQNPGKGLLTENYFVQIGYEVGLFGLMIFVIFLIVIAKRKVYESNLSNTVVACLYGYLFLSLVMHLWSNEAVAAQWWLLAGFLLIQSEQKT